MTHGGANLGGANLGGANHGFAPGLLDGLVAVITGAAGAIGAATTEIMAALGAQVVAADLDADRLAALA
jgi:3-oxoacyl-[acyl-carrier protein] reductase